MYTPRAKRLYSEDLNIKLFKSSQSNRKELCMRTIWRLKCNGRSDDEGDDGLEKHGLVATCKVSLYTYFMSQLLSTKCEDYY